MKFFYFLGLLFIVSCSYSKKTFICGDRACLNKTEANNYFKKNLSIEVEIKKSNTINSYDLVYLNTNTQPKSKIKNNNSIIKILNKNDKKNAIKNLKKKIKIEKEIEKKKIKNEKKLAKLIEKKRNKLMKQKNKTLINQKETNTNKFNIVDKVVKFKNTKKITQAKKTINIKSACPIIDNCDIDKITKNLLIEGKSKDYPNLSFK